jgi:hypothetical protein
VDRRTVFAFKFGSQVRAFDENWNEMKGKIVPLIESFCGSMGRGRCPHIEVGSELFLLDQRCVENYKIKAFDEDQDLSFIKQKITQAES